MTQTKEKNKPVWYLSEKVSDELKPAFIHRLAVSNANKTYLISRLGIFFFLFFVLLDIVRYQSGKLEIGYNVYFYLSICHLFFLLFSIPLFIYEKHKTELRAGTYPNVQILTNSTLFILCLCLLPLGTLSLMARGSLMPFAIFILLINLVFAIPHKNRLIANLFAFISIAITIFVVKIENGWLDCLTDVFEFSGITFPAYLMATYQYNIMAREFAGEKLIEQKNVALEEEQSKSESLLLNILPVDIAAELKEFGSAKARRHESVSILFTDFVNFSTISATVSPEALVNELDACFTGFDAIVERHNLEKIKTVGDAYLCVGGISDTQENHAINTVRAALEMQAFLKNRAADLTTPPIFEARIGIHSGTVVSGVVGTKKFAFDVWGDAVNISARLESAGEKGKVNISGTTYEQIKEVYHCTFRGNLPIKNRGEIDMYFVEKPIGVPLAGDD